MKLKLGAAHATMIATLLLSGTWEAEARTPPGSGATDLCRALADLVRETRAEIAYDPGLCLGKRAQPVRRGLSVARTLATLLSGTGVSYRVTPDGAFILFPSAGSGFDGPEGPEAAINEILVIGRRTQNADIRRTQNDIQPYRVATRTDIERAHRDNVDQFMRSHVSANADPAAPGQNSYVEPAGVRSLIDLRGLGSDRTLVLVDGRRMPGLPGGAPDTAQPDLNGLPVTAIERIETLTGTAGGIYGPGAVGGVVNIVLRRDYRGADIRLTSGLSSRGDSGRLGLEAGFGFTPDGGRTDVMVRGAYSWSAPVLTGDRDFNLRARKLRFANDPAAFIASLFTANSVGVFSRNGDLVLDPEKGGASLGSTFTYLPLDVPGSESDRLAELIANAGRLDFSLPRDESGTDRSLIAQPAVLSALVNIRHRFGSKIEGYADLVYYSNSGRARDNPGSSFQTTRANAPNNPFQQAVIFSYPEPNALGEARQRLDTRRLTVGLIAELAAGWRVNADYAWGKAVVDRVTRRLGTTLSYGAALRTGRPAENALPLAPLDDWASFVANSATYLEAQESKARAVNRFADASVRLAGPLASLPAGPLTLTLLGENRREKIPAGKIVETRGTTTLLLDSPARSSTVRSAYAELRAPITSDESPSFPRSLQLQLAARYDFVRTMFPVQDAVGSFSNGDMARIDRDAFTFTGGMQFFPFSHLMVRASVATGRLPPTARQLSTISSYFQTIGARDVLRGGRILGSEGLIERLSDGNSAMRSERARTLSLGVVFNPSGRRGPRLAIDFSRIDRSREIVPFTPSLAELVANEPLFRERIIRAPVSEADRQAGFTVGRILVLDTRFENSGRSQIDSVDAQLDWWMRGPAGGEIRVNAAATWQPRFESRRSPLGPKFDRVGHADGPLRMRGNVGVEWSRGPTVIGFNLQYYSAYRVTYSDPSRAILNPQIVRYQGTENVSAQAYLDLFASQTFRVADYEAEVGLGISNLLDTSPPILAQAGTPGYSLYGDARRRRFALTLAAKY